LDIRDRAAVLECIETVRPAAILHTASQPSHDLAATIPFDDFETNATGTLNLLEAAPDAADPDGAYRAAFERAWASDDLVEGRAAFNERRAPVFRGE
jgi:dTDP-D-glucose 4,6-dehydratase